jgi:hypothetical protein
MGTLRLRSCVAKTRLMPERMGQRELPRVRHATTGVNIMIRNATIALAAAAVIAAGTASTASARGGGGGGHMGGGFGGGGHFSGGGHVGSFSGAGMASRGNHFAGARLDRDRGGHFRHHRFDRRFVFFGDGFYGDYGDGCYAHVWTRLGWRWQYACQ